MPTVLDGLREEREGLVKEITALTEGENFDPTDKTFVEARSKADALDNKIKALVEWNGSRDAANAVDALQLRSKTQAEAEINASKANMSLGEAWVRSSHYAAYKNTPRGNSGVLEVPFDALQTRAPILTTTFAGLIQPDRIAPSGAPAMQTPLLDAISRVQVGSGSVEWIYYPAAAPLGTVTAEGQPKTEAAVAPELRTVTLDTIASWAQYSRQFGEDAPGLVNYLNASLARGIMDKREALAAATLVADASIPVSVNTGTLLEGIRVAIADVQNAGYRPSNVVLNPADYAALDVSLLGLTFNGPVVGQSFWGVSPIPVGAVPSGTAFVGDFGTGMVELVRSAVQVYTTDSHASTFTSNVLTTLVEVRAKSIVQRAEAIAKVSGTVLAASSAAAKK